MNWQIFEGDCLQTLRGMDDNSVDSIVTDPPYGLQFMGKKWDYDVPDVEVWAECLRVLKPGGHLLAFAGTRTQHRMAVRIEDAGFELRDMIAWIYGSGFPKSHNLQDEWEGWGTALKPALEPITVARKPLIGTVAHNVRSHGTGALNIDDCRVSTDEKLSAGAGGLLSNVRDEKPYPVDNGYAQSPLGRWPANVIHDGSDEVIEMFPANAGAAAPVTKRNGDKFRNTYGAFKGDIDEQGSTFRGDKGSAARFFYCAKTSKKDRDEGLDGFADVQASGLPMRSKDGERGGQGIDGTSTDRTTVRKNNHPTVKPTELMRYLCRLVTPPGGIVLDPFTGSGSTGKAALLEGFRFIGCELSPDYVAIARARLSHADALTAGISDLV